MLLQSRAWKDEEKKNSKGVHEGLTNDIEENQTSVSSLKKSVSKSRKLSDTVGTDYSPLALVGGNCL